jgi:uncharacterized protein
MRETLAAAFKDAMKRQDKLRLSTLRMVQAAIHDRDIANRGAGKPEAGADEIAGMLAKMIKQREESATLYDTGNRAELAAREREEIAVIKGFLPQQMGDDEARALITALVAELGAGGAKDMGRVMAALKERHSGAMDFGKASAMLRLLLA